MPTISPSAIESLPAALRPYACPACAGATGTVIHVPADEEHGNTAYDDIDPCRSCGGTGLSDRLMSLVENERLCRETAKDDARRMGDAADKLREIITVYDRADDEHGALVDELCDVIALLDPPDPSDVDP
jgi:hypothetical protein